MYEKTRNATEMRNTKIRKLQTKLNSGDIDFVTFLNQITFFGNKMIDNMADTPSPELDLVDDDDNSVPEDFSVRKNDLEIRKNDLERQLRDASEAHEQDVNCVVCKVQRKTKLMQPCCHLILCETCCDLQGTHRNKKFKCPLCRKPVTKVVDVFF